VVPSSRLKATATSEATKICVRTVLVETTRHQRHDQQQDQGDQADQGGHGEVDRGDLLRLHAQVLLGERLIFSGRPEQPHGRTTRIATISR